MRLKLLFAGIAATTLVWASSIVSAAPIANGGFETGNLNGWTATIPTGGSIDVVTTCATGTGTSSSVLCHGPYAPYQAREGARFALLKTNGPGSLTVLSQGVQVPVGAVVSGWVFFSDGEAPGAFTISDTGSVEILLNGISFGGAGIVFSANAATKPGAGSDSTPWTFFQFQTPVAGLLSVKATVTNASDSIWDSLLGLDGVQIVEPQRNVGPAIGAIVAGADGTRDNLARQAQAQAAAQQAAGAAAAAAAAAQTAPVLRPPSTGDGGLLGRQDETRLAETAGILVAASLLLTVCLARARASADRG